MRFGYAVGCADGLPSLGVLENGVVVAPGADGGDRCGVVAVKGERLVGHFHYPAPVETEAVGYVDIFP